MLIKEQLLCETIAKWEPLIDQLIDQQLCETIKLPSGNHSSTTGRLLQQLELIMLAISRSFWLKVLAHMEPVLVEVNDP